MTLVEIMVVMVIIAMIAGGASLVVARELKKARVKQATADCRTIRAAADLWLMDNSGRCPTVEQLRESGELRRDANLKDPWGNDYGVECNDGEPSCHSSGEDGQPGSEDDIR